MPASTNYMVSRTIYGYSVLYSVFATTTTDADLSLVLQVRISVSMRVKKSAKLIDMVNWVDENVMSNIPAEYPEKVKRLQESADLWKQKKSSIGLPSVSCIELLVCH